MIGSQERECSTCEEKTFDVSEFSADFGEIRPLARIVLPTTLYQGGQPRWTSFRKLWPQTIIFYPLAKVTHFLTFKRLFPSQDLIAHNSETVHVCFEGVFR
jgi:hypothetical protein